MVIHNHFQREMSGAFAAQTAFLRLAHAGGVKSVNLCELSVPGTEARCRPSHYRLTDDAQLRTVAVRRHVRSPTYEGRPDDGRHGNQNWDNGVADPRPPGARLNRCLNAHRSMM